MTTLPTTLNNRARGESLEELIKWQNNIYANNERALIWHNGTQGKVRGGRAILVKSRPDFEGVLTCGGGRHLAFDAKLISKPVYRHSADRRHQLINLYDVQQARGVAFLLISVNMDRFCVVWPMESWKDGICPSIHLDRLEAWEGIEAPRAGSYNLPDYLTELERELFYPHKRPDGKTTIR